MAWEEYKPKPRGKAPLDFGAIIAGLAKVGDSVSKEYGSKQSCDTFIERATEAAKAAKVTITALYLVGSGEHAGRHLVTLTRTA
jgi:hypothetical protein